MSNGGLQRTAGSLKHVQAPILVYIHQSSNQSVQLGCVNIEQCRNKRSGGPLSTRWSTCRSRVHLWPPPQIELPRVRTGQGQQALSTAPAVMANLLLLPSSTFDNGQERVVIVPARWFVCGKVIGDKWEAACERVLRGVRLSCHLRLGSLPLSRLPILHI